MRIKKKGFVISIILISIIGLCSCTLKEKNNDSKVEEINNNTETKEKKYNLEDVVLNERQKEILTERDLSTNYEELNYTQKRAIVAIEEALVYLENKYNTSFEYAGYIPPSPLDKEKVIAAPKNGVHSRDSFDVIKTEEGYSDDYMLIAQRESFKEYLRKKITQEIEVSSVLVFSTISRTNLTQIPDELDDYEGKIRSQNIIFIYDSTLNTDNVASYMERVEKFFYEKKLYGSIRIYILKDDKIDEIKKNGYSDYLEDFVIKEEFKYIKK
ncbi:hypothetical protein [uncultured Clostridium sp.]|uniref:hypothetical protein n=1 Tax=uncultured Clostridium sp. TaxID=59620 RepID=UPI0025FA2AF6|nr:hypothetical protein [uncultured Clostridium sp.]